MNKTFTAYLVGFLAILFWSFNVIIAQWLVGDMSTFEIVFFRWFIAWSLLFPFCIKKAWALRSVALQHKSLFLALAVIGIVLMNTLRYTAAYTTSAVNMALLSISAPIFLALFAVFIGHQKLSIFQVLGILVTCFGVVMLVTDGHLTDIAKIPFTPGDFFMLGAAFCFALYTFLLSFKPAAYTDVILLFTTITIGLVFLAPIGIYYFIHNPVPLTWKTIGLVVYLGTLPSIFSFLAWSYAKEELGTVQTSVIYYTIPLLSTIEAAIFLHEPILKSQYLGGVFILIGVLIISLLHPKNPTLIHKLALTNP